MRRPSLLTLTAVAALCLGSVALAPAASAAPSDTGLAHRYVPICDKGPDGTANCHAIRNDTVDSHGNVVRNVTPRGYGPSDIRSAYQLPGGGAGQTVAIVDAYDDPYAERDLATYRSQFGLPACTTSNGCFKKVNQNGKTSPLPAANGGWAQEISLDLDMVSAACPACNILLVEANTASFANLGAAVNTAAAWPGVVAISNSYGGSDLSGSSVAGYDHPGVAVTASTGDNGYGVEAPASFPSVVAVGGTSLTRASNARGWSETAWSGAGSGCSTRNSNPGWQSTDCGSQKANADVAAVADPNTGVAVYDSYRYQGVSGWLVFGGTSASSPIVASVYALAGNQNEAYPAKYTWGHASGLNDVTSGSNGSCGGTALCKAGIGWDGPTGLGTPNGLSAF